MTKLSPFGKRCAARAMRAHLTLASALLVLGCPGLARKALCGAMKHAKDAGQLYAAGRILSALAFAKRADMPLLTDQREGNEASQARTMRGLAQAGKHPARVPHYETRFDRIRNRLFHG